jgi:hypothetical protein
VAETLASERSLMRICPIWLLGWVSLCKQAVYGWLDDHAATTGAAIHLVVQPQDLLRLARATANTRSASTSNCSARASRSAGVTGARR